MNKISGFLADTLMVVFGFIALVLIVIQLCGLTHQLEVITVVCAVIASAFFLLGRGFQKRHTTQEEEADKLDIDDEEAL